MQSLEHEADKELENAGELEAAHEHGAQGADEGEELRRQVWEEYDPEPGYLTLQKDCKWSK